KLRRSLGRRLLLFGDFARLIEDFCLDRFGFCAIPEAFGSAIFVLFFYEALVKPAPPVSAFLHIEICEDFPVGPRLKGANTFLPFCKDCQGGCLNPSNRRKLESALFGVKGSHAPRPIDPDEPVTLRATNRRVCKRN